ncbi:trimeric LpxA-like protein [Thamnocephalis sphaerospora]|uniref:Dynactin subunit 6 n=1 Tax=Thamnocephalis sphaerospora TaxID=78915 RepID=A0A4P9XLH8_9FUNG|nr:trimeric LpxA-like protein [Thamnocephalis sphaerospora]|eukprot:RKP06662.1 trimeric LpxA-like protein [Thamnocephalis sphaerospora]
MTTRKLVVGPGALVCQESQLTGNVSIGSGCVLHPKSCIIADVGPIVIGRNNIIEENVVIINRQKMPLIIGDENLFEVGAYVEGARVGSRNIFESRSRVVGATTVGNNCVIGIGCQTEVNETLSDCTVIFGGQLDRRLAKPDLTQMAVHARHLDYLRATLPKFNRMRPIA